MTSVSWWMLWPTPKVGLMTGRIKGWIRYGTRIPAIGSLKWFSPDLDRLPTAVKLRDSDRAEIDTGSSLIQLQRREGHWIVTVEH